MRLANRHTSLKLNCLKAFVAFAFLWVVIPGHAQVVVSAQLDSAEIMIGDQVGLHLFINHEPGVVIRNVNLEGLEKVQELELLDVRPMDTISTSPEYILEQRMTITSFDSGYYFVPPMVVNYTHQGKTGTAQTEKLGLLVNTFPITSDSVRLEPIKPILEEKLNFWDFLPYLIGILTVIGIILLIQYLIRRRQNKEVPPPPEVKRPAHEIALEKLDALREAKLWQQGEIKAYQSELTYIVREYLENRFEIPALESTSDEILQRMKAENIDPDWRDKLRTIFQTADLVKFAKAEPPVTIHGQAMDAVEQFIRTTRFVERPPESTEGSQEEPAEQENEAG